MKRLKIAYITGEDPRNRHSWSGTHYYAAQALEHHLGEVDRLGPLNPGIALFLCKAVHGFSLYLLGKRFNYRHSFFLSKIYARIITKKLQGKNYDLIVAPGGSAFIAFLQTDIPIFYFSDATNANLMNFHEMLSRLLPWSARQSLQVEQLTLQKARYIAFSSQWACNSAMADFGMLQKKIHLIPFGANLEPPPGRTQALAPRQKEVCRLFFLGVDWVQKGGPLASQTLRALLKMGVNAELTVVGCEVPEAFRHPKLINIPFLNKNNPDEFRKLESLFQESGFFILPTEKDCFGIVFCEAAAYGLPSLARNSGGVSSAVQDGISGFVFPPDATADDYAEKIKALWNDPLAYKTLCESSRDLFERSHNWDAWALAVKEMIGKDQNA
jgi:glycosyltransferase involved in cell wall biosynthesis